jgi:hypothetical protein
MGIMIQKTSETDLGPSSFLPSAPVETRKALQPQPLKELADNTENPTILQQSAQTKQGIDYTQEALASLNREIQELLALLKSMEALRQKLLREIEMIKAMKNGGAPPSRGFQNSLDSLLSKLREAKDGADEIDRQIKEELRIEGEIIALSEKLQAIKSQMLRLSNESQLNAFFEKIKMEANRIHLQITTLHTVLKKKQIVAQSINLASIESEIQAMKAELPLPSVIHSNMSFAKLEELFFLFTKDGKLDEIALRAYLKRLCDQLKSTDIQTVTLSFFQGSAIDDLLQKNLNPSIVNFNVVIDELHKNNIQVAIGLNGQIINPQRESAELAAIKWSALLQKYDFDAINFDTESAKGLMSQGAPFVKEFLSSLHELLQAQEKKMILTLPSDFNLFGKGIFTHLFNDENNNKIFSRFFDRLNLIHHRSNSGVCDARWWLEPWLDLVGKEKAQLIQIESVNKSS